MRAFKVRRNDDDYFRVELPKGLFPDGKRRSVMAKTRREAIDKAQELLQKQKKGLKTEEARRRSPTSFSGFSRSTKPKVVSLFALGRIIVITSMRT
jgi:hypothetical protein